MEKEALSVFNWFTVFAVSVVSFLVLCIVKRLARSRFEILDVLNGPLNLSILFLSFVFGLRFAPGPVPGLPELPSLQKMFLLVSIFWIVMRLTLFSLSSNVLKTIHPTARRTLSAVIRGILLGILTLLVLDTLGVSIGPILAALGVGSLAVALALQETLTNLFSGIYIYIDKPFRVGDFISIDGNKEGTVQNIGWRSTRILLANDDILVVPNFKLSSAIITNHHLAKYETIADVELQCTYNNDLNKVEQACSEVAKEVMTTVKGGVPYFEPTVHFHTVADVGVKFTVTLLAQHITHQAQIRSEFIKRIHKHLVHEMRNPTIYYSELSSDF